MYIYTHTHTRTHVHAHTHSYTHTHTFLNFYVFVSKPACAHHSDLQSVKIHKYINKSNAIVIK